MASSSSYVQSMDTAGKSEILFVDLPVCLVSDMGFSASGVCRGDLKYPTKLLFSEEWELHTETVFSGNTYLGPTPPQTHTKEETRVTSVTAALLSLFTEGFLSVAELQIPGMNTFS